MEAPGQLPSLPSPISSPGTGNVYKTSILTFFEVYIYIYIYMHTCTVDNQTLMF